MPLLQLSSITISGQSFGSESFTLTILLGQSQCNTASWTSSTSLKCSYLQLPFSDVSALLAYPSVVNSNMIGTGSFGFTFDGMHA